MKLYSVPTYNLTRKQEQSIVIATDEHNNSVVGQLVLKPIRTASSDYDPFLNRFEYSNVPYSSNDEYFNVLNEKPSLLKGLGKKLATFLTVPNS